MDRGRSPTGTLPAPDASGPVFTGFSSFTGTGSNWTSDDPATPDAIETVLAAAPDALAAVNGADTFIAEASADVVPVVELPAAGATYSGFFGWFATSPILVVVSAFAAVEHEGSPVPVRADDGRFAFGSTGAALTLVPVPVVGPALLASLPVLQFLARQRRRHGGCAGRGRRAAATSRQKAA